MCPDILSGHLLQVGWGRNHLQLRGSVHLATTRTSVTGGFNTHHIFALISQEFTIVFQVTKKNSLPPWKTTLKFSSNYIRIVVLNLKTDLQMFWQNFRKRGNLINFAISHINIVKVTKLEVIWPSTKRIEVAIMPLKQYDQFTKLCTILFAVYKRYIRIYQ